MNLGIFTENKKFREVIKNIKRVYLSDDRPWVVGFSGGKDSTAVVQLVFNALSELNPSQLHKKVYVISSDTLVETPLIISSITKTLERIQDEALDLGLPIETHKVRPQIDNTFWVSIIGKGYPSPRQKFRWCTDRLKIEPANRFIIDKVSEFGEVVMVLGVRDTESSTRASVMQSHTVEGKDLMLHSSLPNAYVYAPIRSFTTDDVWDYLLTYESPWGNDNHELLKLYQDSNSECPLVVDKEIKESAGSCGNSRFGCWTCTVVSQDKALSGFINNGEEWLRPLLEFRNWLSDIRDNRSYRQKHRMNGQVYLTSNLDGIDPDTLEQVPLDKLGEYLKEKNIDLANEENIDFVVFEETEEGKQFKQLGLGPFNFKAREMILKRLLETQQKIREKYDPAIELISPEELKMIRKIWFEHGHWDDSIPTIYHEITGEQLDWEDNDKPLLKEDQITDLERLCKEYNVNISILKQLIAIERKYAGYKIRRGVLSDFEKVLNQEFLHL